MTVRRFFYHTNSYQTSGSKEFSLGLGVRSRQGCRILVFGWGYDEDVPLRPWPQVWHKEASGETRVGMSWLGLFVSACDYRTSSFGSGSTS